MSLTFIQYKLLPWAAVWITGTSPTLVRKGQQWRIVSVFLVCFVIVLVVIMTTLFNCRVYKIWGEHHEWIREIGIERKGRCTAYNLPGMILCICVCAFMYKPNMMLLLFLFLCYHWKSALKMLISENWIYLWSWNIYQIQVECLPLWLQKEFILKIMVSSPWMGLKML